MTDFTDDISALVAPPSRRADVVPLYATAILFEMYAVPPTAKTRWSIVNRAIIARWSISGLIWIKQRAWRRAERQARQAADYRSTTA